MRGGTNTEILGACVCVCVLQLYTCFIYCIWVYLSAVSYLGMERAASLFYYLNCIVHFLLTFFVVVLKARFQSQWLCLSDKG